MCKEEIEDPQRVIAAPRAWIHENLMKQFSFDELCDYISRIRGNVAVLTHERADADTIGSAAALGEIFVSVGAKPKICSPDGIPDRLSFFGIEPAEPEDGDVLISVDVPSLEQLGRYAVLKDRIALKIDHHRLSEEYAPWYVDSGCAAAGEIVYDIHEALRKEGAVGEPSLRFSMLVYAAISSDTGGFRFSNTTPETHLRAAELLKSGIDSAEINRLLFENLSEKEVAVRRIAYSSVNIYDGRIAAVTITKADRERCGADINDISCAIDVPRGIRGIAAAALIKESDAENEYRISLRSNTDLDVSAVAGVFGGGGHIRAAGASLTAYSPEEAEKTVVDAIKMQMAAQGMA